MKSSYQYGKDKVEVTDAAGVTGILCRSLEGRYFLRVQDASSEDGYIDYHLKHSDLTVTIAPSEEAGLYLTEPEQGMGVLDHAPETLGLTKASD